MTETTTISGLPNATLPLTGTERLVLDQGAETVDATVGDIANLAAGKTDLDYDPVTRQIKSSTGADATLPLAGPVNPGLMTAAQQARLGELAASGSPSFAGLTITGTSPAIIPHIHGDLAGNLYFHVKNTSGVALTKGTPVTAGDSVGNTNVLQIVATDPATPGAEYADGLLKDDLPINGEGHAIIAGELQDANTAAYTRGPVYVGASGGLSSTRPASRAQQVATLGRQHAVNGSLLVAIQGLEPTPAQIGAATAAQGAKADSAVQPAALSTALASKADLVGGVIPTSQIPAIAISDYLGSVNSEAAMLALTGQRGDWCLRTDSGAVGQWILSGDNAALVANWVRITVPASPVQSVNGQVGAVVLGPADIGAASTAVVSNAAAGLAPAIGTPSGRYLRDDATWATVPSGGGGSPAGTATEIQYRNGAAFGAIPGSVVDNTTGAVTLARLLLTANGAASAASLRLSGTWFTGGTNTTTFPQLLISPTGATLPMLNTAGTGGIINAPSGFTGDLFWLGVNGVLSCRITSAGTIRAQRFEPNANGGYIGDWGTNGIAIGGDNAPRVAVSSEGLRLGSNVALQWANGANPTTNDLNTGIYREADDVLGQRNATTAQTSRIYNTFTSATNFERAKVGWADNILRIGTEKGTGGGTARDMELQTDGTTRITLKADGAIIFTGLPTTNPAVTGQLWNDGGTLKISA